MQIAGLVALTAGCFQMLGGGEGIYVGLVLFLLGRETLVRPAARRFTGVEALGNRLLDLIERWRKPDPPTP